MFITHALLVWRNAYLLVLLAPRGRAVLLNKTVEAFQAFGAVT